MKRGNLYLILAIGVTLAIGGLLSWAAAQQEARLAYWERIYQAQAIENGAKLFEANCRACHGVRGEGVGELGPALNDASFFTTRLKEIAWPATLADYVESTIAQGRVTATRPLYAGDGRVVMAAWAQEYGGPLRPDEISDLAAFVLNWEATALGEAQLQELALPDLDREGNVSAGKDLFLSAGCAKCHTVAGLSEGATAPELTHIATVAGTRRPGYTAEDYLRESFLIPNAYVVEGYAPNQGCGGVLSESQLDDLIAFLMSLE